MATKKSAKATAHKAAKKSAPKKPAEKKSAPKASAAKKATPKVAAAHATKKAAAPAPKKAASATKTEHAKPTASYSKVDLAIFGENIESQLQDAREELESLTEHLMDTVAGEYEEENSVYSLHMADQGTDAMEREKDFLQAQRLNDYIKKLEEALRRIEDASYGVCVMCGQLIEKPRLLAVPVTQKHVDCKNKEAASAPRPAQSRTEETLHHFPESN